MKGFVANILLALSWALITDDFTSTNVLTGFILGYVILRLSRPAIDTGGYVDKIWQGTAFFGYFLYELFRANVRMVYHVLTPHHTMTPGVIGVPLEEASSMEITLLANLITLTPGTLSVDVSDDRSTLWVHAVDCSDPDAVRREIKEGFERRLLEVTR